MDKRNTVGRKTVPLAINYTLVDTVLMKITLQNHV